MKMRDERKAFVVCGTAPGLRAAGVGDSDDEGKGEMNMDDKRVAETVDAKKTVNGSTIFFQGGGMEEPYILPATFAASSN